MGYLIKKRYTKLFMIATMSLLLLTSILSMEALASTNTIIPYMDTGYKYSVVAWGNGTGFENPTYIDSGFSTGDAGFGTLYGCSLTTSTYEKTEWPLNTDILVRKHFTLPSGANNLKVGVAIDNDVKVFINGIDISGGTQTHEGCAARDSYMFSAPDGILKTGDNLIAVRGIDRGVASYLDIQVTADIPDQSSQIPEFPTVALPVIAVIGLMFLFERRKGK